MPEKPSAGESGREQHYLQVELYELLRSDDSIFDFIQSGSLDGVWYWDIEHPEQEWMSPRFWQTMGYDPSEFPHLSSAWQDIIDKDDLAVAMDNFKRHCENPDYPYDQIVRYRHKDGSTVWIRCRGLAIRDASGRPIRMLGAHSDVTQLKEAELALQAKNDELINYSYAVSHDLKGPVANALLALEVLASRCGDRLAESERQLLVGLQGSMSRMIAVINELHRIALLEGGQEQGPMEPLPVSDAVALVSHDLAEELKSSQAEIRLDSDAVVVTSRVLFIQLLYNLVQNAIKYRNKHIAPVIRIGVTPEPGYWRISVADNGIGIAEQDCGRVFDFLKRVNTDPSVPGAGLGLSFCKKAIARLGGSISVKSVLGEGSEFSFTLPRQ